MQFPSVNKIYKTATTTLRRFPLALLSACIAVICAVYLADVSSGAYQQFEFLFNVILVCLLGISLFIFISFTYQHRNRQTSHRLLAQVVGIILLIAYYFTLPPNLDAAPYKHIYRYMLYVLALHLLVAVGPFWGAGKVDTFWKYNKTLFLRFLTAVFFSGVLFAGLAVALGSIQVLLEIDVKGVRYFQLFLILGGVFNTWFFLSGVPLSVDAFNIETDYPKGLKVFTRNILIPLVVIYLLILYIYMVKIVIQWTWPEGWVANLVLSFSIVGILALLLLHPIRNTINNKWINKFSGSFFVALVPLVILLLLAINRRIWEYGFTVERYFVLTLGLWLAGMVVYFLLSKSRNIKIIPASLCVIAFLVSLGPWSAFSVSERSQINRLERFLQQNDLLQNKAIRPASEPVPFDDRKEISSIIRYLNDNHGIDGIQPWFTQDLSQLTTQAENSDSTRAVSFYERPQHITELMNIKYVQSSVAEEPQTPSQRWVEATSTGVISTGNIRWLIREVNWSPKNPMQEYELATDRSLIVESNSQAPHIRIYPVSQATDTLTLNMQNFVQDLADSLSPDQHNVPAKNLIITLSSHTLAANIHFTRIQWSTTDGQFKLENARFDLGIK